MFAIEIYNGHIYVHVDLGAGPSKLRGSRRRIDDGSWHEVTFRRTGRESRITVDGFHTDFKTAGLYYTYNIAAPYHILICYIIVK